MALLALSFNTARTSGQLQVPASGALVWDKAFRELSAQKIPRGADFNLDRASGLIAIPTGRDPVRTVAQLSEGAVVGALYVPVAYRWGTQFVLEPGFYAVRVLRRESRWLGQLLRGTSVVQEIPVTVQDPAPFAVREPVALLGFQSRACYIWDSLMVCI
jgi:hypothetical protein